MAATTSDPLLDDEVQRRHNRLASSMQDLRTRAGGADKARVLLVMGGVLIPLGIVLILLGWSGVSHTTDTFEQTPYVISGGLLGLALVVAGGFCYFGYWQTQVVRAVRRDAADIRSIRDSLQHIEELLAANPALTGNGATPNPAPSTSRRKRSSAGT
jgi:hypothetical protein